MAQGRLFYLIGSSGSGKDSLMRYARERLAHEPRVVFAHRYITRPPDGRGENHVALTAAEFAARRAAGLFAMHWHSHGLSYGIGREIDLWLERGCHVVLNGSREYLPQARQRHPELTAVLVTVAADVLAARLRARGRETEEEIAARLERAQRFCPEGPLEIIRNDGDLREAGEHLVRLLAFAEGRRQALG